MEGLCNKIALEKTVRKNIKKALGKYSKYTLPPQLFTSESIPIKDAKEYIRGPLRLRRDKLIQLESVTNAYKDAFWMTREHVSPVQKAEYQVILALEVEIYQGVMEAYVNFKTLFPYPFIKHVVESESQQAAIAKSQEARKKDPFCFCYDNIGSIDWEDFTNRLTATYFIIYTCHFLINNPIYFYAICRVFADHSTYIIGFKNNYASFEEIQDQIKIASKDCQTFYKEVEEEFSRIHNGRYGSGGDINYELSEAYSEPKHVRIISLATKNFFGLLNDGNPSFLSFAHLIECLKSNKSNEEEEPEHSKLILLHKFLQPFFISGHYKLTSLEEHKNREDNSYEIQSGERLPKEYIDCCRGELSKLFHFSRKSHRKK
ncbi:hypothetical protein [Cesiribacter sp. SM1]|uniref:hypothetical protein n=1 Tax=Cesiribacter sp. SM1 TaxID=2861196 RepID=UPI001CD1B736|nr:hypothetical protein [Cesiribacter sp. SM1]